MSGFAIIACRLPNGLNVTSATPPVLLNGANASNAQSGFGYTRVDADFAKEWLNPKSDPAGAGAQLDVFKSGGLFMASNIDAARKEAASRSGDAGGFDRLDPDKPAPGVEPTDEMRNELKKIAAKGPEDPNALDTGDKTA